MSQVADDLAVGWYQACDEIHGDFRNLTPQNALWVFASLESALFEVSQIILDRNQEIGIHKNLALFLANQDPAFESLAASFSAAGFDARFLTKEEAQDPEAIVLEKKSDVLLLAMSMNSRFSGEKFKGEKVRETVLKKVSRTPVLTVNFEQKFFQVMKPDSWEIKIQVLWSGRAVVILGDRLRLNPKAGPYQMSRDELASLVAEVKRLFTLTEKGFHKLVEEKEYFSRQLPVGFRLLQPSSEETLEDRVILVNSQQDGSFIRDSILKRLNDPALDGEIGTLSGCWDSEASIKRSDERRQEWIRNNCPLLTDTHDARGGVIFSTRVFLHLKPDTLLDILKALV